MNHIDSHVQMTAAHAITQGFWHASVMIFNAVWREGKGRGEMSRVGSMYRTKDEQKEGCQSGAAVLPWGIVMSTRLVPAWWETWQARSLDSLSGEGQSQRMTEEPRQAAIFVLAQWPKERWTGINVREEEWKRKAHLKGAKTVNMSCALHLFPIRNVVTFHSQKPRRIPEWVEMKEAISNATFTNPTASWCLKCGKLHSQTKNRSSKT